MMLTKIDSFGSTVMIKLNRRKSLVKITMRTIRPFCHNSFDCNNGEYCCVVIEDIINMCCKDPFRSVEYKNGNLKPLYIPIYPEYLK